MIEDLNNISCRISSSLSCLHIKYIDFGYLHEEIENTWKQMQTSAHFANGLQQNCVILAMDMVSPFHTKSLLNKNICLLFQLLLQANSHVFSCPKPINLPTHKPGSIMGRLPGRHARVWRFFYFSVFHSKVGQQIGHPQKNWFIKKVLFFLGCLDEWFLGICFFQDFPAMILEVFALNLAQILTQTVTTFRGWNLWPVLLVTTVSSSCEAAIIVLWPSILGLSLAHVKLNREILEPQPPAAWWLELLLHPPSFWEVG